MRIFSWNVNGVRAVARRGLGEWMSSAGADVVALQETKAAPEQLGADLLRPGPFESAWCWAERPGYSGVATFYLRAPLSVERGLGEERFDREGRTLITRWPELTLYNIYFPSGSSGMERVAFKLAFYERFLAVVAPRIAAGEPIVVVGDVNTAYAEIDLARPRENRATSGFLPEERAALGRFFEAGLIDTFRALHPERVGYSWWTVRSGARERNIGWRLDYVLVSPALRDRVVAAEIHPDVQGSDHCPVSVTLDV